MEEIPIAARDDAGRLVKELAAHYGPPAYVRRALRVQEAFVDLVRRCRQQRDDWLKSVRMFLKILQALAGKGSGPETMLDEGRLSSLFDLAKVLDQPFSQKAPAIISKGQFNRALGELRESVDRFNRRWRQYLQNLDLQFLNRLREDYNRYYVLEKECTLRSPRLARQEFVVLQPVTWENLLELLPLLISVQP